MPSRRFSTKSRPYEVVSVIQARGARTSDTRSESFDDENSARKRAEKIAKEKNVRSVYLRHLDSDGDIIKSDVIKKPAPAE